MIRCGFVTNIVFHKTVVMVIKINIQMQSQIRPIIAYEYDKKRKKANHQKHLKKNF